MLTALSLMKCKGRRCRPEQSTSSPPKTPLTRPSTPPKDPQTSPPRSSRSPSQDEFDQEGFERFKMRVLDTQNSQEENHSTWWDMYEHQRNGSPTEFSSIDVLNTILCFLSFSAARKTLKTIKYEQQYELKDLETHDIVDNRVGCYDKALEYSHKFPPKFKKLIQDMVLEICCTDSMYKYGDKSDCWEYNHDLLFRSPISLNKINAEAVYELFPGQVEVFLKVLYDNIGKSKPNCRILTHEHKRHGSDYKFHHSMY